VEGNRVPDEPTHVTERLASAQTTRGELVLRRRDGVLELISNGTFLMDTSDGASERAMATLALDGRADRARVLVAGMGFGFTLAATLSFDVADVVLVELEPAVVAWNEQWWPLGRDALRDARVRLVVEDFTVYLQGTDDVFDAVLVDIDNGPDWTVADLNDELYDRLLGDLRRIVQPVSGRLCVWSASASDEFERRLARHFPRVATHELDVPRGEPDVLFLATG
jgi:spermidine synthase